MKITVASVAPRPWLRPLMRDVRRPHEGKQVLLGYLLAFPLLSAGFPQTQDACASMLPKDLQLLVARRIPGYRNLGSILFPTSSKQ